MKTRYPSFLFLLVILACGPASVICQTKPRIVHVFVALADNQHQGIVPVPPKLGNGDDPDHNLYWGAAYGVRTLFRKSKEWKEIGFVRNPNNFILERIVFQHRADSTLLVADAYRGSEIKQTLLDFFHASGGIQPPEPLFTSKAAGDPLRIPSNADLNVYVGHDGLMDFQLSIDFSARSSSNHQAIILACASKSFFATLLRSSGAEPLLWTTGLMAPEAYTLEAALDGWVLRENKEQIRQRAAAAYAHYQKCSAAAALHLFSNSW